MKHLQITIILAILFAFSACTQEAVTPTTPAAPIDTANDVIDRPAEPLPEPSLEPEPQTEVVKEEDPFDIFRSNSTPTTTVDADLQAIRDRISTKTDGISYVYHAREGTRQVATDNIKVWEKEGKYLALLPSTARLSEYSMDYDSIFVDTDETIKVWCADCRQWQGVQTLNEVPVQLPPAALSWLEDLGDITEVGTRQIDGKTATTFSSSTQGQEFTIGIDRFSGVPIYVNDGEIEHTYERLAFKVSDSVFEEPVEE